MVPIDSWPSTYTMIVSPASIKVNPFLPGALAGSQRHAQVYMSIGVVDTTLVEKASAQPSQRPHDLLKPPTTVPRSKSIVRVALESARPADEEKLLSSPSTQSGGTVARRTTS